MRRLVSFVSQEPVQFYNIHPPACPSHDIKGKGGGLVRVMAYCKTGLVPLASMIASDERGVARGGMQVKTTSSGALVLFEGIT